MNLVKKLTETMQYITNCMGIRLNNIPPYR